jgi:hypothetical protein
MTFKEILIDDLDETFFNLDEFAETHNVDGRNIEVVITDVQFTNASTGMSKKALNPKESAINLSKYLLFIRDKDARGRYTVNAMIKLDGQTMFIQTVKHTMGVWQLGIGRTQV